jgi:hypothetical protein
VEPEPLRQSHSSGPPGLYAHLLQLTLVGGVAFWVANFATSLLPVAADYRAAMSIPYLPMVLVESLVGGLIVGLVVSVFLIRLYPSLPTRRPVLKALVLSAVALAVFTALTWAAGTLAGPSDASRSFLLGVVMNVPRFVALGVAVGYAYERLYAKKGT